MLCSEGSVPVEVSTCAAQGHLTDPEGHGEGHVSDTETNIELFGANFTRRVWRKKNTIPTVKYGGGSIMLWGCF